jgi:ATP-dependent Clp protease ATP-binding subunit ClpA
VAEKGYDKLFGARPMARLIDEKIKEQLVDELLFGKLEHGGTVKVDVESNDEGGKLVFAFEAKAKAGDSGGGNIEKTETLPA